jgi:hypothetical protein
MMIRESAALCCGIHKKHINKQCMKIPVFCTLKKCAISWKGEALTYKMAEASKNARFSN